MHHKRWIMIFGLCLLLLESCSSTRKPKKSDHFDGNKFFNPTLVEKFYPGFLDVFRLMREPKGLWPLKVANEGIPRCHQELKVDDIAITFVNHATFLIQMPGLNILTDPIWSPRASPLSWIGPKRVRPPGVKLEELPKIDLVLISHNHYDHLDKDTLRELNARFAPKVVVAMGDKELVQSIGIKDVTELDWWENIEIGPATLITFTPTQHSSARSFFDRDKSLWGSYFIRHGKRSVYFGGDAGYSVHYSEIKKRLGPPEIALLGIGAFAPKWFMQTLHMDPAEAVTAHKDLGAKTSIGMHYGTFPMATEAFDQPLVELKKALEKEGLPEGSFITLHEGETKIYGAEP